MRKKNRPGRPEKPENERKKSFSTKLAPMLIERIKKRATVERRSTNNLVEIILDENV